MKAYEIFTKYHILAINKVGIKVSDQKDSQPHISPKGKNGINA
jgi:hypothetical protein